MTTTQARHGHVVKGVRRRLPWVLWAVTMVLIIFGVGLVVAHFLKSPAAPRPPWLAFTLDALTFGTVGLIVAIRRHDNPIGWLFLVIGVMSGAALVTGEYAMYVRYVLHDALPGASVSAWICAMAALVVLGVLPFVLLLFPSGQFLSQRWRRFAPVVVLLTTVSGLAIAFGPAPSDGLTPGLENPFAISTDNPAVRAFASGRFELAVGAPLIFCTLAAVASLLVRWRSSQPDQRAQLKWVLFAAAVGFGAIVVSAALIPLLGDWLSELLWILALPAIPVACGVSILRYRLYDIDRIVSRTVTYAALTGLLVASYAGLVTAVSRLTPSSSSLAVASSTLAVAALFQPLRRWLQGAVDRRFNRARYDAARTVEAFRLQLRDEVDLEAVRTDLLSVVRQTLQPESATLWLRGRIEVAP